MQQPGTCWVGFPVPRLYRDPVKVLVASTLDGVMGVISEVEEYSAQDYHMVGMLSYEAAPAFDPSLRVSTQPCAPGLPLAWFAVYKDGEDCPTPPSSGGGGAGSGGSLPGAGVGAWAPSMQRSRYDEAIASLRGCIKSGDAYQVNLTLRLRAGWERRVEEDGVFLAALLRAQRCSYGAYLNMGDFRVLSASPELFFSWDRGTGALSALPMKGTRPRGLHAREDAALHTDLKSSEKDAAENLMIVDLLRNDMGRLAKPGSVAVTDLFKITAYPTVWQMTTRVSSVTREGCTLRQVLTALFPCGSITGAPKVSAMGIIESLEGEGRGVYCGAIVHIAPRGVGGGSSEGGGGGGGGAPLVTASVPIRTLLVDTQGGKAIYGVGGGVTWDSKAEGEWDEAHAKAAVLRAACGQGDGGGGGGGSTSASVTNTSGNKSSASVSPISIPPSPLSVEPWFSLFETLRLEGGEGGVCEYTLLARHLQRMQGSAVFLGFPWDTSKAEAALESCRCNTTSSTTSTTAITTGQTYRVRLTLSLKGDFTVTKEPLVGGPCNPCFLPLPPTLDPLQQHPQHPLKLALLAPFPVPHRHPLLFHKTTDRGVYDVPKEAALKAWRGGGEREHEGEKEEVFDVLLYNERGEVTEFTIGSIVCCLRKEGEGEGEGGLSHHHHHYVTPPISSGCLPGVFREELVSGGSVKEAPLTINDVRTALAVWLVNSVRGWVPIRLH